MKDNRAIEAAKSAMETIRRMVAAYEVDYELLAELRADRDEYEDGPDAWAREYPGAAAKLVELAGAADGCADGEEALRRIHEDPISVQVRSGWADPGEALEPAEYEILLTTGGPAVRIVGNLRHGFAASAHIEGQDWDTPWVRFPASRGDEAILLAYAGCFFFGGL